MPQQCNFCESERGPLIKSKGGAFICEACAIECVSVFFLVRQEATQKAETGGADEGRP